MFKRKNEPVFFAANHCDHIVEVIRGEKDAELSCCGKPLSLMTPKQSDELGEKHLPVIKRDKNKVIVAVGNIYHPMEEKHSIGFVYLKTKRGAQRVDLKEAEQPVVEFLLADGDEPVAAYAFCNLHGFWKTDID